MDRSPRTAPARRRGLPLLGLVAAASLALAGCSAPEGATGGGAGGGADDPVAVATTTQLGSILDQVATCAGASSATVMGPGDDPHDFSASSRQVAQLATAELVVSNGLGLEAGLQTALDNAAADGARVLQVAPAVDPLPFGVHSEEHADEHADEDADEHEEDHTDDGHGAHDGHDGHDHEGLDPHFWMDAARMARAAELIGDELAEATGEQRFADCGAEVSGELGEVDAEVRRILAGIPEKNRTLVTDHEAYAYFAEAYDFEIGGVVIPGGSTDAEPSSGDMAALVAQMQQEGADALVTGAGGGNKLVQALSAETGGEVPVVEIYEGGIGPEGSGAETYAEAMVLNARTLAEALA
ncbi:metal ABC transporter substrate-binding protein [Citricoccus sp. NPDC055426]|uniref:metal ABC transporter substrate-binding protein n=1 Tax=Citricoccus sp. NPDC055426 TaxID=3155536 RepID=UPI003431BE18